MAFNLTPSTPSFYGLIQVVNTGTNEWFSIMLLLFIYIVVYITSVRANALNPFLPTAFVGVFSALFLYVAQLLNPVYVIVSVILLVITIGMVWGQE